MIGDSPNQTPEDLKMMLDMVPTEDLVEALFRRSIACVVVTCEPVPQSNKTVILHRRTGNRFMQLGMLTAETDLVKDLIAEDRYETPEDPERSMYKG